MIHALLSFSLCSGLLLGIYHLLLKSTTLYHFNRYYLLCSLLFSMTVPFITIKTNVAVIKAIQPTEENIILLPANVSQQKATQISQPVYDHTPAARIVHPGSDIWVYSAWACYAVISLLLLARFARNLYQVSRSIREGRQINYQGAKFMLIENKLTPHTFLNYIFINKKDHEEHLIDAAILKHELAHARQLHTIDIIFIELLQAIAWFNPFIFFYRKAIELNHEFIADAVAIAESENITSYQYLLLNTASYTAGLNLTSQFNYLTIKKRLMMMNRSTSATRAIVAKVAIAIVFGAAFFLFCAKSTVFAIPKITKTIMADKSAKVIKHTDTVAKKTVKKFPPPVIFFDYPSTKAGVSAQEVNEYQQIVNKYVETPDSIIAHPSNITATDKARLESIFGKMSRPQQMGQKLGFYHPSAPLPAKPPTQADLDIWKNPRHCGVWIDGKRVDNSVLNNYQPSDFGQSFSSRLSPAAINYKKFKYEVSLYTTDNYARIYKQGLADMHTTKMFYRMKPKRKV